MCRVYEKQGHRYVRLCYVHGARRGQHVPVPPDYTLPGRHYPRITPSKTKKRVKREKPNRCAVCGACMSRHSLPVCTYCIEEARKGLRPLPECYAHLVS